MKHIPNRDNLLGSGANESYNGDITNRKAFINRPTKGKTSRKRLFKPTGTKTNVGDPCKSSGGGKRK